MLVIWSGEVVYEEALRWQRLLSAARADDAIDDVVLTLTHDPVYTAGRHADLARNVVADTGIRLVEVQRGGDVTYHGPGQLVAYPIRKLRDSKAVRSHVDALVGACAAVAASYGLPARADRDRPGVWVGNDKLAAVGVRVHRRVTSHGLAFNVDPDLDEFRAGIIPCGIPDAGVCSLRSLGIDTTLTEVRRRLTACLGDALGATLHPGTPADLGLTVGTRV
ncbi:MAG: lipoyl(octanoyl) transferase LipB [Euzebyaceae bacterium]|jgi:lipoate-protein ligase B|nr:lipoyl(octanoyl) transferase LipB [Euzebyaceae bacterium]MDQ3538417.1 lipoyl(octanoyl) transferase LipB [Actinomycetota bacterium]